MSACAQIERLGDAKKQGAEIDAFFGKYDEACDAYKAMGRLDLAVQLFMRLGHWERVENLVKARHPALSCATAPRITMRHTAPSSCATLPRLSQCET